LHLIIGPTNSGKSTWIHRTRSAEVAYAFQFIGGVLPPPGTVLHYNLLLSAPVRLRQGRPIDQWDLLAEPLLHGCLTSGRVSRATVIVAPVADLLARAARRRVIEPALPEPGVYSSDLWLPILRGADHSALCGRLFDILDAHTVPHRVVFNADGGLGDMPEMDRSQVDAALRGGYAPAAGDPVAQAVRA